VGSGWRHDRDLQQNPLRVGECICSRTDCVLGLYKKYVWRPEGRKMTFAQNGGWTAVADGPVPLDGLSGRLRCNQA
ncbi:unnamed protein product, partial [Ectocarpus sp. 8 AP-2014]